MNFVRHHHFIGQAEFFALCAGMRSLEMMEQDRLLRGKGSAAPGGTPLPLLCDGCRLCSFAPFVGIPRRYPNPSTLHMQILQVSPTEPATVSARSKCLPHQTRPLLRIPSQPTREPA